MSYWKVKCPEVTAMLDAWEKAYKAGERRIRAFTRQIGMKKAVIVTSFFTGLPEVLWFTTDKPFARDKFSSIRTRIGYYRIRASCKELRHQQREIFEKFVSLQKVHDLLHITSVQVTHTKIWAPRWVKKDGVWYFAANAAYKGCNKVRRISDIQMEKLFPQPAAAPSGMLL